MVISVSYGLGSVIKQSDVPILLKTIAHWEAIKNIPEVLKEVWCMKIVDIVYEIVETLKLGHTNVIKVVEFGREITKYGFALDDLEAGVILYHIIKHLLVSNKEVILDFAGINDIIPYYLANESLSRLAYEYGKSVKNIIKVVNVTEDIKPFIDLHMKAYVMTMINTRIYTDEKNREDDLVLV
jgi:hypothetical protein